MQKNSAANVTNKLKSVYAVTCAKSDEKCCNNLKAVQSKLNYLALMDESDIHNGEFQQKTIIDIQFFLVDTGKAALRIQFHKSQMFSVISRTVLVLEDPTQNRDGIPIPTELTSAIDDTTTIYKGDF